MTDFETLKRHVSLRGIVMTILAVVVAGLAIATLRYQPSVPDERSVYSPTSTAVPAGPWLAPAPDVAIPSSSPASPPPLDPPQPSPSVPPPSSTEPPAPVETFVPTQTYVPTQAPGPTQTPTSSAPPTSSSTFTPRRDTNPTELPNGGRRFGTVQP